MTIRKTFRYYGRSVKYFLAGLDTVFQGGIDFMLIMSAMLYKAATAPFLVSWRAVREEYRDRKTDLEVYRAINNYDGIDGLED